MCDTIIKRNNIIETIKQFQDNFNVDAKKYGWDGDSDFIDCCLCNIDLNAFFKDNPQLPFVYKQGDWLEQEKIENK